MRLHPLAGLAIAGLLTSAAHAQSPDQRLALNSFRDTVAGITSVDRLRELKRPAKGAYELTREGLRQLREGELGTAREPFDNALITLDRALQDEDKWPYPWYALGQVRWSMWNQKLPAKATPRQAAGLSYREATLAAYAESVERDPGFRLAAQALADVVLGMGHQMLPEQALPGLTGAVKVADNPAVVHLAMSRMHFRMKRYTESLAELEAYRTKGGDPGVAAIESARSLGALERWPEAVERYLSGLQVMDSLGRAEYRGDLAWIAAEWEMNQFDSLPLKDVGPWITRFFREREALELRRPNERMEEHIRRWVKVHRDYILLRTQDAPRHAEGIDHRDDIDVFDYDAWDRSAARVTVITQLSENIPTFATYQRTQWEVDDRGVIYMRHGAPAQQVSSVAGTPNESWSYDLPDGVRIFHFRGSKALGTSAATTLVASLPMDPAMLTVRGTMDPRYVTLANRIEGMITSTRYAATFNNPSFTGAAAVGNHLVQQEIVRNQKAIAVGVSTDAYPLSFKRPLEALVQVYGVGLGAGQTRRVLGVFVVPGRVITPMARTDGGSGLLYPISIRLVAMDREHGVIRQLDTTRVFLTQDTLKKDQYLTGLVELPIPAGTFQVRALVTSPGLDAGAAAGRDSVRIPEAPTELTLSDLVLGRPNGMGWNYGGRKIALNPLNAYLKGADGELFYEVSGLTAGATYETSIAVHRASDKPKDKAALEITSTFVADAAYRPLTQGIGLRELKPGNYRLTVTITERGSDRSTTRWQALNILDE